MGPLMDDELPCFAVGAGDGEQPTAFAASRVPAGGRR
jgi:hypothetical protein